MCRIALALSVLAALLFLHGDVVTSDSPKSRLAEYHEFREADIAVPVPDVQQPDEHTCGVAALMAVLSYYGVGSEEYGELAKLLHATKKNGTNYTKMAKCARQAGLEAVIRKGMKLDELECCLRARRPVIVSIQAYETDPAKIPEVYYQEDDNGHYVVAIGFDDKNLYFMDPSLTGRRGYLPKREFELRWHDNEGSVRHPQIVKQLGIILSKQDGTAAYYHQARRID